MAANSLRYLSLAMLLLMAAAVPVILRGTEGAIASMFNAPVRWIPANFAALRDFRTFTEEFDVHEMILISWPGCTIDDERLKHFAEEMQEVRERRQAAGEPELFAGVPNGFEMLRDLTDGPAELSRERAIARLTNLLVGPDGQTSCAAVELTPLGAKQRDAALEIVLSVADDTVGLPRDAYRLAGPPIDGIAIDQFSIRSIRTFALPSALLSLVLCGLCLRSVWFTWPVIAVATIGQGVALAAVYYAGASMNAVLIVLPPLVFVLAVSAGVHLVNYCYEELRGGNFDNPVTQAFAKGWRPSLLAAVTTAVGLGSLLVSDVAPVRQFGFLGAFGVLLTWLLLFLLLPGMMLWWPAKQPRTRSGRLRWWLPWDHTAGRPVWDWMATLVQHHSGLLTGIALILLVVAGYGLTRVTTTLNVVSLLSPETRAVQDYHWFQEHVTPLVPVEVVVHFDEASSLDLLERAMLVARVHAELVQVERIDAAISPATFMPPPPRGGGLRAITQRAVFRSRLEDQLDELSEAGYLRQDEQEQMWRVSGRVQGRADIDYGLFLDLLRERIDPLVHEAAGDGARVIYTGVTSAVYEVQRALLADLFNSFLTAILLIGCVMVLALRSLRAGLIAMIPNILPTVMLFGAMGWLEWDVDIGSVMTASVALGIAVDGTFHFLASFRREVERGKDRIAAIRITYGHCGRALVQTALICAAGMVPFTSSSFLPARSFALMLLLLLLIAAISDLVVLPALLAGPLGRWFVPSKSGAANAPAEGRAPPAGAVDS